MVLSTISTCHAPTRPHTPTRPRIRTRARARTHTTELVIVQSTISISYGTKYNKSLLSYCNKYNK
jgi:hypothetical protein